jgi:hypothetical protein
MDKVTAPARAALAALAIEMAVPKFAAARECWIDRVVVDVHVWLDAGGVYDLGSDTSEQIRSLVRRYLSGACKIGEISIAINDLELRETRSWVGDQRNALLMDLSLVKGHGALGGYCRADLISMHNERSAVKAIVRKENKVDKVVFEQVELCLPDVSIMDSIMKSSE